MTSPEFRIKEPGKVEPDPVSIYNLSHEIEALALEIAKGQITTETLIPLLDAITLEEHREELEWMESQEKDAPDYFAGLTAKDQETRKKWKEKLKSSNVTAQDREWAYAILLKSGLFHKIFTPVLVGDVGKQMDQISKILHTAANQEIEQQKNQKK